MSDIKAQICDFNNKEHCNAVIMLLNHYMSGTMGGSLPLHSAENGLKVIDGLKKHPSKLVILASIADEFVGMTVSFINFSTFSVKPFINIHDVIVLNKYRRSGIGKRLMEETISHAKEMGCSKITLEVREDNFVAQGLYKRYGFEECRPPMHFWSKYL